MARAAGGGRDCEQQRAVGTQGAGCEVVDGAHRLHSQRAPCALVGERGIDEPIQQHDDVFGQQRSHQLLHELCAGGGVEERLGASGDGQRGVLDERADALGDVDSAGLSQQLHGAVARGDLAGEGVRERGLAGTVEPLDRDQLAAGHPRTVAL